MGGVCDCGLVMGNVCDCGIVLGGVCDCGLWVGYGMNRQKQLRVGYGMNRQKHDGQFWASDTQTHTRTDAHTHRHTLNVYTMIMKLLQPGGQSSHHNPLHRHPFSFHIVCFVGRKY